MLVECPKCSAPVEARGSDCGCETCGNVFRVEGAPTRLEDAPRDPRLGTVIGGCRLTERIGAGGMGVVYRAEQLSLGRVVAVKLLAENHLEQPQLADRFRREISVLARLGHPNIVSILDGDVSESGAWFVMEYVDGVSLRRILANGGVSPLEALRIIPQLCDALEYAHARGVVHRDLKPENVILDRDGRVRLLDFGLSRLVETPDPLMVTRPTQILGTFEYMAPEQREASRTVDHRADLYSLGVLIYEMLTGELPIGRFDPPSHRNIQVDIRLDEVVLRVLQKDPARRYQRASEIKTEIERIGATPPSPEPSSTATGANARPHRVAIPTQGEPPVVARPLAERPLDPQPVAERRSSHLAMMREPRTRVPGVANGALLCSALAFAATAFLASTVFPAYAYGRSRAGGMSLGYEGMAIFGVTSFFALVVAFLGSVLGITAMVVIRRAPERFTGMGRAISATTLGILSTIVAFMMFGFLIKLS